MKILHCCLSCFYIDNYNYQENALPRQNKLDGHEVMILASTETIINNKKLGYINPSCYVNEDGIKVVRIPYSTFLPHSVMKKLRIYKDSLGVINEYKPDVILFHGAAAYELMRVAEYKKYHPNVKLYVDSHEDFNNSARSFLSKQVLHRLLYKRCIKRVLNYIEKVLCVSMEAFEFMRDFYGIPSEKLEFYPLGGTVIEGNEKVNRKMKIRNELNLRDTDMLFVHSGKMNKAKQTIEILKAFKRVSSDRLRLVLLGSISEDINEELMLLINNDNRVNFLGWKNAEELKNYLCAADMYLQPGSQSATLQNAICCGCPVMIYLHKSYEPFFKGNGFLVETIEDMTKIFETVDNNPEILRKMGEASYMVAYELLDYRKLAARLYK